MKKAIEKLLKAVGGVNSLFHYHLKHRVAKILVRVVGFLLHGDTVADAIRHRAVDSSGFRGSGAAVFVIEREAAVAVDGARRGES